MKNNLAVYLENTINALLLVIVGLTPLLLLNQTTDFYETPKLIFLVVFTVILLGLWIFSWIIKGKVVISRTPLDVPLLILLVVIVISTYFSVTRSTAIYGDFPRVSGSAVAWVTYILLYFVTVSHLRGWMQIRTLLYVLYSSAIVVAFITLLSFFHLYLPFDFAKAVTFTPTGSSFSTIALLLLLLPLPLMSLITPNKYIPVPFAIAVSILFGGTIVLIGSLSSYIALLLIFGLCLLTTIQSNMRKTLPLFAIPAVVIGLLLFFSYVPFAGNGLHQFEANFPKEIQLPFPISWKITLSSFRDSPFIGTGPSTYLYNFTQYKPAEFNLLNLWSFSFDTAHDEFLEVLGTLGVLGFFGLIALCLVVFNASRKNLFPNRAEAHEDNTHILLPSLAISGLLTIILLAMHASTLVSLVTSLFIMAALMMSQRNIRERVMEFSIGIKASTSDNKQFDLFPIIIFIIFLVGAVPVLYTTFNVTLGDYYHHQALLQTNKNGTLTYKYLQKAETLSPMIDSYREDMAQTNFILANAIASKVTAGQTKTLSDQDKTTIQTLLSQSVNEARVGVILTPRSAQNWEVLAAIYRNIAGVAQNSLTYSLSAYSQAIQLDPINPALRMSVGGIYYGVKNYNLAIRFFSDAANLKPDYANAYYNLAIAYQQTNDLQDAFLVAQQAATLLQQNNPNSADYKTAAKLLADIKSSLAKNNAAAKTNQQPPAAQTTSALQNPAVPNVKVPSLNNPPSVTPPAAVKANPNARLPLTTPSPAPKVSPTVTATTP